MVLHGALKKARRSKSWITHYSRSYILHDLQDLGGGPVVVVVSGVVETGGGRVVGMAVLIGVGIVVKIGTSQLDWPEIKSEFEFKFGQVSNSKQILSVS